MQPKPVYYTVGRAYNPVMLSAAFLIQSWSGYNVFSAHIWISNALNEPLTMDLSISLADSCGKLYGEKILKAMCGKNSSRKVTDYQFSLAEPKGDILLLIVEGMLLSGQIAQARYVFTKTNNFSEILSLEKTDVKYAWECPEILLLHNTGKSVAFGLKLEGQGLLTAIDDNYLYLLPGEIKRVHVQRDSQDQ